MKQITLAVKRQGDIMRRLSPGGDLLKHDTLWSCGTVGVDASATVALRLLLSVVCDPYSPVNFRMR